MTPSNKLIILGLNHNKSTPLTKLLESWAGAISLKTQSTSFPLHPQGSQTNQGVHAQKITTVSQRQTSQVEIWSSSLPCGPLVFKPLDASHSICQWRSLISETEVLMTEKINTSIKPFDQITTLVSLKDGKSIQDYCLKWLICSWYHHRVRLPVVRLVYFMQR